MAKAIEEKFVKLECTVCKKVNFRSHKNKRIIKNRLELKKFCRHCRKHTLHKETK